MVGISGSRLGHKESGSAFLSLDGNFRYSSFVAKECIATMNLILRVKARYCLMSEGLERHISCIVTLSLFYVVWHFHCHWYMLSRLQTFSDDMHLIVCQVLG